MSTEWQNCGPMRKAMRSCWRSNAYATTRPSSVRITAGGCAFKRATIAALSIASGVAAGGLAKGRMLR